MEAFTELGATALVNAEARKELERVAAEQAAHGRVATLVAEAAPSAEIFDAVAREVSGLFAGTLVVLSRYEPDGSATAIAAAGFAVDAAAAQAVDLPVLVGGRVLGPR
jgi:hypothetical protein